MAYIMLSANYYCTINKTQDNQLVVDVCLLVMGSEFLQAKALHRPASSGCNSEMDRMSSDKSHFECLANALQAIFFPHSRRLQAN